MGVNLPKASVEAGATLETCGCGQNEIVVVLVGCTQHGKSSLIRSILDYGGHTREADQVECGSFGNKSTTTETKDWSVEIKIKDHILRNTAGIETKIDLQKEEPEDLYDLSSSMRGTNCHLHLRLIDTPGLDDSGNKRESSEEDEALGNGPRVQSVDERHKLLVLKALANIGELHAVIFVLDWGNNLGMSIKNILRAYMDLFEISNLGGAYYFAHTTVHVDRLFTKRSRRRPGEINRLFGIQGRSKHYMVNSVPDDDEISKHFSNWALAKLFTDLSTAKCQSVDGLKYPKSEPHDFMDTILEEILDAQKKVFEDDIEQLRSEKASLASSLPALRRRLASEHESWQDQIKNVAKIETEDYERIGYQDKYERSHLFSTSTLSFEMSTGCPIRKLSHKNCADSFWTTGGPGDSSDRRLGGTVCSASLRGNAWCTDIRGSIELKGWRKEAKAADLKLAREQENAARKDWKSTDEKISTSESVIKAKDLEINEFWQKITKLEQEIAQLHDRFISIPSLHSHAAYFASSSIVSYATGLELARVVPKAFFSSSHTERGNSSTGKYRNRRRDCLIMISAAEMAHKRIESDQAKLVSTIEKLEKMSLKLDVREKMITESSELLPEWQPLPGDVFRGDHAEYCRDVLLEIQTVIKPKLASGKVHVQRFMERNRQTLQQRSAWMHEGNEKLKSLLEDAKAERTKLDEKIADLKASAAAANLVQTIIDRSELPVGILAAWKQSIAQQRPDTWVDIFFHIKEVYKCDPELFQAFEMGVLRDRE